MPCRPSASVGSPLGPAVPVGVGSWSGTVRMSRTPRVVQDATHVGAGTSSRATSTPVAASITRIVDGLGPPSVAHST